MSERETRQGRGLQPCPLPTRLTSASHLLGTAVGQPLLAVAVKATGTSAGGIQRPEGVMGLTEKPALTPCSNKLSKGSKEEVNLPKTTEQCPSTRWL